MKLSAPAKINLSLRIEGRRPDGFHELDTVMTPVSLADEITVITSIGRRVRVVCDHPDVPVGPENLATRAAHLFSQATGQQFAAEITIAKRIPMGAGLGGGSSNAATVLIALDTIFETQLGVERMEALAAQLGSDVPFFVRSAPARCRGRGEIIEPIGVPAMNLLLVKPPFAVETPWAYRHWKDSISLPGDCDETQDCRGLAVVNDLERPVFEKFLLLPVMKKWLREQPETAAAAMSGSGSTMFAILRDGADGAALESRVRDAFGQSLWTALCHTPA